MTVESCPFSLHHSFWMKERVFRRGKFTHVDGDTYTGQWQESVSHGLGVYSHKQQTQSGTELQIDCFLLHELTSQSLSFLWIYFFHNNFFVVIVLQLRLSSIPPETGVMSPVHLVVAMIYGIFNAGRFKSTAGLKANMTEKCKATHTRIQCRRT